MAESKRVSNDPELTELLERATKLRVTIRELGRECGEEDVTLWRWQFMSQAPWKRREAFFEKANAYLDAQKKLYEGA